MDLDTYDDWAAGEWNWFRKRLLEEGAEALRQSCSDLGEAAVRRTLELHRESIADLLHTPKNRRGPAIRRHPAGRERHAFLIASAYTVRCGSALLDLATRYGFSAGTGIPKSMMLLQAATVAQLLRQNFPPLWPFDDLPDPFAGPWPAANDDDPG